MKEWFFLSPGKKDSEVNFKTHSGDRTPGLPSLLDVDAEDGLVPLTRS